jgi:uncharacterized cupin superfamily protein
MTRSIRFDPAAPVNEAQPMTAHEWYRDPSGAFTAGFWAHQGGTLEVTYTEDEFCTLLEGEVHLTDQAGHTEIYRAGDSFVIPQGFKGQWTTVKPLRKFYAIYEPKP